MGPGKQFWLLLTLVLAVSQLGVGQKRTTPTSNKKDKTTVTTNKTNALSQTTNKTTDRDASNDNKPNVPKLPSGDTNMKVVPSANTVMPTKNTTSTIPLIPFAAAAVVTNCHIYPNDTDVPSKIKSFISAGVKIIKYNLKIKNEDAIFANISESSLYKPLSWVRTTGRQGRGILLLRPEYGMLSLTTLELGVRALNVTIRESPSNCLTSLRYTEIEQLFRELAMNDFQNTTSGNIVHLEQTDSICNMHVINETGVAEFRYLCCNRTSTLHVNCVVLETDLWLNVLFWIVVLIKILVLLFSPNWIPSSIYRLKKELVVPFTYITEPGEKIRLRTIVTNSPEKYPNIQNVFRASKFRHMTKFKVTIQKMIPDVTYDFRFEKLQLMLKQRRLLYSGCAPVGLFESIYTTLFRCKVRRNSSVQSCCDANVCLKCCTTRSFTFSRLLREIMNIVLIFLITLPWVLRVTIYYNHEHDELNIRKEVADEKQLRFYFPGSVALYLSPLHALFVVIYLILSLESFIFGALKKKSNEKLKFVLRKCFNDMQDFNKQEIFGWVVQMLLLPFVRCGVLGFVVGPMLWVIMMPVAISVLSFYMFPTINLTGRLLAHFVVYLMPREMYTRCKFSSITSRFIEYIERKMETKVGMKELANNESVEKNETALRTKCGRFQQLIIILFCLMSLYSCIFLMTEFVSFAVEVVIYTMIGVILNASLTLTYISLGLYVVFYANGCISNVVKAFLAFSATLNGYILKLGKSQAEPIFFTNYDSQLNRTFRVRTGRPCEPKRPVCLVKNKDGEPRWKFTKLVLFVSNRDQPAIPKKFFFDACKMSYPMAPGDLFSSYISAFKEFAMIITFLIFVLIVVLAFGETYELSASNHLLATIAGGFVPLMLRRVLFKAHSVPDIDADNDINFQVCVYDLLNEHRQSWSVFDIDVGRDGLISSMGRGFVSTEGLIETNEMNDSDGGFTPGQQNELNAAGVVGLTPVTKHGEPNDAKLNVDLVDYPEDDICDLVIDISCLDKEDFPNVYSNLPYDDREIGSTSFLDDSDEVVALSSV